MKQGFGIALACVWAGVLLPSAWPRLFPEAKGFSVTQLIVAIVGGSFLYLVANVIGELVEYCRSSREHEADSASSQKGDANDSRTVK